MTWQWNDNRPIITDADYWICIASDFFGSTRNSFTRSIWYRQHHWNSGYTLNHQLNEYRSHLLHICHWLFGWRLWQVSSRTRILFSPRLRSTEARRDKISRIHPNVATVLFMIHARQTHNVILTMIWVVFFFTTCIVISFHGENQLIVSLKK